MRRSLPALLFFLAVSVVWPRSVDATSAVPYDPLLYAAQADCVLEVDVLGVVEEGTWRGRALARPVLGAVHSLRCRAGLSSPTDEPILTVRSTAGHRAEGTIHWRTGRWRLYLQRAVVDGHGSTWGVLGMGEGAHWQGPLGGVRPWFETDNRGPDNTPLRWAAPESVSFVMTDTVAPGLTLAEMERALTDALDAWSAVGCSRLGFVFDGVVPSWSDAWEERNHVVMVRDPFIFAGGRLVLGSTGVDYDPETGDILAVSVLLNGVDISWSIEGDARDQWDLRGVVMHELGHALGLAHTPVSEAVMVGTIPSLLSRALQHLHDDDVLGVCSLYPCDESAEACAGPMPPSAPGTRDGGGLCAPCVSDGDCGGARDRCDGQHCLRACSLLDPCPLAGRCVEVEGVVTRQCRVADGRCARRALVACAPCDDDQPCADGQCGEDGHCLLACSRALGCPTGMACTASGPDEDGVCLPDGQQTCAEEPEEPDEPSRRGRRGCATAPGESPSPIAWAGVVLAMLVVRRRRR